MKSEKSQEPEDRNKGGRPPLEDGRRRVVTSISTTREMQIEFRRLGGSRWLRKQIEKAMNESTA